MIAALDDIGAVLLVALLAVLLLIVLFLGVLVVMLRRNSDDYPADLDPARVDSVIASLERGERAARHNIRVRGTAQPPRPQLVERAPPRRP